MKLNRTKNAISGTILGATLKVYQIICPFIIRTVFLYTLGVKYLGLNGLFTSIIQVLNIAELGIGTALVFSMYKPIAENDENKICAILKLYRFYYRMIGLVVLLVGLALTPFLKYLISGDIPKDINLYVIYFLNLLATVLSYWLFAYRNSLFNAYQRTDIISLVGLFVNTVKYVLELIILFVFKNYYLYLLVLLFAQLLNNISIAIISLKYFPQYRPVGEVDRDTKQKINRTMYDLFCSKIGQVVTGSFDTLVISAFLGLSTVAIYQNYYYIINSLFAIFTVFYKACLAGVGNSLLTEKEEKNYFDFKRVTYIVNFLLSFCVTCLLTLYPIFMRLWLKNNDLLLNYSYVVLFVIYFLVYQETILLQLYKDGAGNWHKDRYRPLIAAFVNLGVNLILIHMIGLYGIIISSIVSFIFVNLPWIYIRLFNDIFKNENRIEYFIKLIKYIGIMTFTATVSVVICKCVELDMLFGQFIFNLLISSIISIGMFLLLTYKQEEHKAVKELIKKVFKTKK